MNKEKLKIQGTWRDKSNNQPEERLENDHKDPRGAELKVVCLRQIQPNGNQIGSHGRYSGWPR